jgi:DNA-binding SARP family transcriptional activator/tetratricopeptide (TPR) repeat protein
MRLVVRLLGDLQVRRGISGAVVPVPARKVRALLAYLATHPGRAHPRDRLTALLWPDVPDSQARQSLRQALAGLRRALTSSRALVVDADTVAVDPLRLDVDVIRFERLVAAGGQPKLQQAVALYQGDLLDGFHVKSPAFEDWLLTERERFRELARQALAKVLEHQSRTGATEAAIHTAGRLLALDVLREDVHRAVMRLYVARGQRGAALRQYQSCVGILRRELGVEPEAATKRLYQEILQHPLPSPPSSPPRRGAAHRKLDRVPGEVALIGREAEVVRLRRAREQAWDGQAQAALLTGEAGIGKTRVLEEAAAEAAAAGGRVLVARSHETEQVLPFQAWIDAFRSGDVITSLGDLGGWRGELARLFPEVGSPPRTAGNPMRLLDAMLGVVDRLAARQRLLIVLDDLHWADEMSVRLFSFIGRRLRQRPVLLLGSVREEDLTDARMLRQALTELDRDARLLRLSLSPLSHPHTVELVRALLRRGAAEASVERLGEEIWRASEGNPFVIVETVRELLDGTAAAGAAGVVVPRRVRDLVCARLERLAEPSRRLAAVAAVIGRDFSFALLQQAGGLAAAETAEGLEELVRRRIVSATGEGFDFAHGRFRRVVYDELLDPRRRTLHAAVGAALEALCADRLADVSDRLAYHALQADQQERALDYLLQAADRARTAAAHRDEATFLTQALAIAETYGRRELLADLRARRGKAFARLGMWASAKPDLEAGLEGVVAGAPERRAELLIDLAEVCFWSLDTPALRRYASEAAGLVEEIGRHELMFHAEGWLAMADNSDGHVEPSMRRFHDTVARARTLGITPPGFVLPVYCNLLNFRGAFAEAVERGREAVEVARRTSDTANMMFALPHFGHALAGHGRYGEAEQVFAEARRFGREYGVGPLLARAIAVSAGYRLDVFDFRGNEAINEEARDLARSVDFLPTIVSAGLDLLLNLTRRHEVDRAERLLADVTTVVEKASGWHGWIWRLRLIEARAELALAHGHLEETVDRATAAIELNHAKKVKYEAAALDTRAKALHALGRTSEAIADLRRAVQLARPTGDPAMLLRAAAGLLALDGDDALIVEASTAAERISRALPDLQMQRAFAASGAVCLIRKFAPRRSA